MPLPFAKFRWDWFILHVTGDRGPVYRNDFSLPTMYIAITVTAKGAVGNGNIPGVPRLHLKYRLLDYEAEAIF